MMQGYYRQPSIAGDRVVFVSEDDLWELKLSRESDGRLSGYSRRLTRGRGAASYPAHSPDGTLLAYVGTEDGSPEVYVMPASGGPARQLTFNGAMSTVVGWTPDGSHVIFRSNYREPFRRSIALFQVPVDGGQPTRLPVGAAHSIAFEPDGPGRVIARFSDDLARWKRYRGGTAGVLWVDASGEDGAQGDWARLKPQFKSGLDTAGLIRPMWLGGRIYFVSDEEGYGNIYSCLPDGSDVKRHTEHVGFYARFARADRHAIVYTVGGALWYLDGAADKAEQIHVDYASPRTALARKFVDAEEFLYDFALHPKGHSLAVCSRGKLFNFGNWEGATRQNGQEQGVRYRLARYLNDGKRIVVCSDEGGEEHFEVHRVDGARAPRVIDTGDFDLGRPIEMKVSPVGDAIAFSNHRNEVIHLDLQSGDTRLVDASEYARINGLDWSADGRWIAYGLPNNFQTGQIRIYGVHDDEVREVTSGDYLDVKPIFDPKGRYLYFLSYRKFNPVYDEIFFELSFPQATIPCVVTLREDVESLFVEKPRPLSADEDGDDEQGSDADSAHDDGGDSDPESSEAAMDAGRGDAGAAERGARAANQHGEDDEEDSEAGQSGHHREESAKNPKNSSKNDDSDEVSPQEIDFGGIRQRVEIFPGREANYGSIQATESRIYWMVYPVEHVIDGARGEDEEHATLKYFSLERRRTKTFARGVDDFILSHDHKTLAMWTNDGLRVVSADGEGPVHDDSDDDGPSRSSGFIDLGRLSVSVLPREEWGQMLREAWRLMRDHFWRADMSGVDWQEVWQRYSSLLDCVGSRAEFSDLVWTMQGELGTSHAFELGGDYPTRPYHPPGFLGAELQWDAEVAYQVEDEDAGEDVVERGGWRITHIIDAETWDPEERSPLARPGVNIVPGDVIVAIDGQPVDQKTSVDQRLVNRAGLEVELVVVRAANPAEDAADGSGEDESTGASTDNKRPLVQTVTVKTLRQETSARYREWVYQNRKKVHELSGGKLGYIHIPDMGPQGFAEFHRGYVSENTRKGLVVDVRFNGGGHVSQLLLEKLARRHIGYDIRRWEKPMSYPEEALVGPMVALTNEQAGSDGDIFSHSFKLMGLGPLLGKRTWGGVIGIWPRHELVDGSVTTQPEFSFWFKDVGFGLENYGAEPDIEVELPPGAQARGEDPQLRAAVDKALELLAEQNTELPQFAPYPQVAPPAKLDSDG